MGQKMSFSYRSKSTISSVRQTYTKTACWEVSLTSPTSLSRELFKYLLVSNLHY
ncbi:hypothetical protein Lalb_Chr03g0040221 [Lupinus albus]|uniref:Uncharacterized protein n=1 Tax=Lupinus albus TaxID=3870 RepID=A0A6A4QXB1_LUPAL|nr:hypothetical protein Lalb_Chr03g0040221 [Lupinus albus]